MSKRSFPSSIRTGGPEEPSYHFKRIGLEAGPLSQWLYGAFDTGSIRHGATLRFYRHKDLQACGRLNRAIDNVSGSIFDDRKQHSN